MLISIAISSAIRRLLPRIYRPGHLLNPIFRNVTRCLLVAIVLAAPAHAVEMSDLYTVQVVVDSSVENYRDKAYRSALSQVLVRVTGSQAAAMSPDLAQLFPDPSRYVLRFSPGAENSMLVSFDGGALEKTLRDARQPVWGRERPLTLVWLAVDRGNGQREIVAAQDQDKVEGAARSIDRNQLVRERLMEVATRRGIPVVLPLLDAVDQAGVSFSDIWGGFDEQLLQASKRYGVNSILVGRLRLSGGQKFRWSYYWGGQKQQWTDDLEEAINRLADYQASEFAFAGDRALTTVALRVSGVTSVDAYVNLQSYLETVPVIDSVAIGEVQGDYIEYQLHLKAGIQRLVRALDAGGVIERAEVNSVSPGTAVHYDDSLDYFLKP